MSALARGDYRGPSARDSCYGVCPDNAVVKLGPGQRLEIDLDDGKGCCICAAACPCGAIDMVPEPF